MKCLLACGLLGLGLHLSVPAGVVPANAEELAGAEAALQQWREAADRGADESDSPESDPLRDDLGAFAAAWPTMSTQDAAMGWLDLYDRWAEASADPRQPGGFGYGWHDEDDEALTLLDLVEAIPGPDVWPTLQQQVEARTPESMMGSERALRLLVFYLGGDTQMFQAEAAGAVQAAGKIDQYMKSNLLEAIAPLTQIQSEAEGGGGVEAFGALIAQAKANPDAFYRFEVPDLVTLYGEDEARSLLEQIVTLRVDSLEIEVGDATRRLATQIATEKIDTMFVPRWELVAEVNRDSVALYEAMDARFAQPAPAPAEESGEGLVDMLKQLAGFGQPQLRGYDPYGGRGSWQERQARVIYLLGLVVLDRIDDATAFVEKQYTQGDDIDLPWGLMETLQRSGVTQPLFDFAERMIDNGVSDALWPMYIELGAQLEQSERVLEKVENALAGAEGEQRLTLLDHLISARFAADDVEAGIVALREKIAMSVDTDGEASAATLSAYAQMARIGQLMDREDWLGEGLERAVALLEQPSDPDRYDRWERESARGVVIGVMMAGDRWAEAEALLIDAVELSVAGYQREKQNDGYARLDQLTEPMVDLVGLYGEAERWGDVLTLLNESPYWGVDDLLHLQRKTALSGETPLVVYVARALRADGQAKLAREMVSLALNDLPGEDALYELLVELDPASAVGRLDELFARDQFEERPLIWKAKLQLEAGDIKSADETIRHAIRTDPSDGEQGPGDRMRAYAVLADVLRAQGDVETAEVMEGAVRAIRMSEDADEFDRAGLLSRAVAMYKEALTHFADAYCIQSRLAIQLANLGRYDEAAEHYKRAYELMPDSFGRVESHCFGCEGAFTGDRAQTIAERVFDELVLANPLKPQIHYLRGYLYAAQGKDQDALASYRQAVLLDSDYLNAWAKIQRMASRMQIDRAERDRVALEIFRLDPLGRHSSADLSSVADLAAVWRAVEAAQPLRVEAPESLQALPASAAWTRDQLAAEERRWASQSTQRADKLPTPGSFLAQHGITRVAVMAMARGG